MNSLGPIDYDGAFDVARRANSWAPHIGMQPVPYRADALPAHVGVELKYDGLGLCYVDGRIWTLQGVDMGCASHLKGGLDDIAAGFGCPMFMQGEYVEGSFNSALSSFRRGEGTGAVMLFDAVPIAAWDGLEDSAPADTRRAMLEDVFRSRQPGGVGLVPQARGFDVASVQRAAEAAWEDHQEGIVTKDLAAPFVRGPSRYWMKLKREETVDGPIVRINTGFAGGALVLKSIVVRIADRDVTVPRGFKESERRVTFRDEFSVGRWVELKHNGHTEAGALQGVSFVRFRDDKESES